jgi:hypothetical protein
MQNFPEKGVVGEIAKEGEKGGAKRGKRTLKPANNCQSEYKFLLVLTAAQYCDN